MADAVLTELLVSGHLMRLEAGLFCLFAAPDTPPPDPATGLPGVRLSPSPGASGLPGRVAIGGFRGDGWIGGEDAAALVRVTGGPAQVLVTVYQAKDSVLPAPRLQVLRLAGPAAPRPTTPEPALEPGAPRGAGLGAGLGAVAEPAAGTDPEAVSEAPPRASPAAAPEPSVEPPPPAGPEAMAHVYGRGDVGAALGEWVGEPGGQRWIEGFAIAPRDGLEPTDLEYQAVLGQGWLSPWAEGGQFCGSRGMSLPILGLRVRLRGHAAERFDAAVTATFLDGSTVGPVLDGGVCESGSLAPLEAFRVALQPRAPLAPSGRRRRKPR